jgi:hypothetical protein
MRSKFLLVAVSAMAASNFSACSSEEKTVGQF